MDYPTVAIIIGTNFITAASALLVHHTQRKHSEKMYREQTEAARETDRKERKREVRSEPLLKLRSELARIAQIQEALVKAAHLQINRLGVSEEDAQRLLVDASNAWNDYLQGGAWQQTIFMLDDQQLVKECIEISDAYRRSWHAAQMFQRFPATYPTEKLVEAMQVGDVNRERIARVQSRINQLLEEL